MSLRLVSGEAARSAVPRARLVRVQRLARRALRSRAWAAGRPDDGACEARALDPGRAHVARGERRRDRLAPRGNRRRRNGAVRGVDWTARARVRPVLLARARRRTGACARRQLSRIDELMPEW